MLRHRPTIWVMSPSFHDWSMLILIWSFPIADGGSVSRGSRCTIGFDRSFPHAEQRRSGRKTEAIRQGLAESQQAGVQLIGEITSPPTDYPETGPDRITFAEVLGLSEPRADEEDGRG